MTEERALIERASRGEVEAQDRLARLFRPVAYRIAFGMLGDPDAADDVAQDALVRLSAALPGFVGAEDLRPWVYRVTVNLCRDQLRRRKRRSRDVSVESVSEARLVLESTPETTVDRERARAAVTAALDRLPDESRQVLELRYLVGLPYHEIARVTKTAQGTIASRVFRALRRLGEEIDPLHLEVLK